MNRVARAFCILATLSSIGILHAQDEGKQESKDDKALVEAGKKALASIKPLEPGAKYESYFEITMGPDNPLGYVAVTLEAAGTKEKPLYHYKTATANRFPDGKLFKADVDAKLLPNLEPIEAEIRRTITDVEGIESNDVQRAEFGEKTVKLTAKTRGGEEVTGERPRPEPPFIYGIETVVQLIDFNTHKKFILREFNLQTGKAGSLTFTLSVWTDGTPTVVVTAPAGQVTYQFWYDDDGKLIRWGMPAMPVMFVRATKEKVRQLGWKG